MNGSPAPVSVVIADDTPDIRLLLRSALSREGMFRVVGEAGDGQEAVQLAGNLQPDLVLLDLAMPVMDGLEALPLIRRASPHSRVVVLSGFNSAQLGQESIALGASAYLEKGTRVLQIVSTLKEVCGAGAVQEAAASNGSAPPPLLAHGAETPVAASAANLEMAIAGLAHELRTPLTVIQGFADMIESEPDEASFTDVARCTAPIIRACRHMTTLINGFADSRRLDLDALDLSWESVDLVMLVRDTIEDLAGFVGAHTIGLSAPDRIVLDADATRVRQIVTNLVTNAAKFSPADTSIAVHLREVGADVMLTVTDEGPGISIERRGELFEKFSRLGASAPGVGLGLYLSRGLARAHGGDLRLDSSPGAKTQFVVSLPRARAVA